MAMINFGIDLGTSNSLVAYFDKGVVEVFKNPTGFKETLPSIVGFRNDKILIGDQARTYAERDPKSVVSRFKRKMGTSETFKIKSLNVSKTPIELSAYVLKELKSFVQNGQQLDAAVITIPASFDTVQSNATKEAGLQAGFKSVVLLQEPIAASLAFANKERTVDLRNSQWLVYDLGGGTFDVALVRIVEGELTVVDHEGDNFLGGTDLDALIVEKLLVPELEKRGKFADLLPQMKSESGRYNKLWYTLLALAETAKVELSAKTSSEIDLGALHDLRDDDGNTLDATLTITRSKFDGVIQDSVDTTIDMMKRILTRNSLQPDDLKFILMVGGSTYIPSVRKRVEEVMGIPINTSIDPTNAIAVGAAYFAGGKDKGADLASEKKGPAAAVKLKASYNKSTQELEETFSAKVEGDIAGYQFRITGNDGSYDSGLKKLAARISEDLPLRESAYNIFTLKIFDAHGNTVPLDFDSIQIAQGRYSVAGQMLPEDLCLVKDKVSANDTILQALWNKNTVLPSKATKTVEVGRTVSKGTDDEIRIMVVEGPANRHSSTNKPIGILSITGRQVSRDLIKGTEIDLKFDISESRELTVSAYLNGTGQEFSQVFVQKERTVSSRMLASEILLLETKIQEEIDDASKSDDKTVATGLEKLLGEVQTLIGDGASIAEDDVTDKKFQIEDKKRRLAQQMFDLTSSKRLSQARTEYQTTRSEVGQLVRDSGNDKERHFMADLLAREQSFVNSSQPEKLQAATAELERIRATILVRTPQFLVRWHRHLVEQRASMNDQLQAKQLIDNGKRAIESEDWDDLRLINGRLWDLMPAEQQAAEEMRVYTGIV